MSERLYRLILILIQFILITVVFLQLKTDYPFFDYPPAGTDMTTNLNEANGIISGSFPGGKPFERIFLYSYFLSFLLRISGGNLSVCRFLQSMLLILITIAAAKTAEILYGKKGWWTAAVLSILYWPFYAYGFFFLDTILQTALFTVSILMLLSKQENHWKSVLTGLISALFVLIRPNTLILFPVFILSFVRSKNWIREGKWLSFSLSFLLFVLIPVFYNYSVCGELKLIRGSGSTLWIGNNPKASGGMMLGKVKQEADDIALIHGKKAYIDLVKQFVFENPAAFARLQLKKILMYFEAYEVPNNLNLYEIRNFSGILKFIPAGFWLICPFFLSAAFFRIRKAQISERVLFLSISGYILAVCIFFVISRFRIPAVPLMIIAVSGFLIDFPGRKAAAAVVLFLLLCSHERMSGVVKRLQYSSFEQLETGGLISDDNGLWRSRKVVALFPGRTAEKVLKLADPVSGMLQVCLIAEKAPVKLKCRINDNRFVLDLIQQDTEENSGREKFITALYLIPGILSRGKNSFIVIPETDLYLPYDDSAQLGRSSVSDGKKTTVLSGELMIRIYM